MKDKEIIIIGDSHIIIGDVKAYRRDDYNEIDTDNCIVIEYRGRYRNISELEKRNAGTLFAKLLPKDY